MSIATQTAQYVASGHGLRPAKNDVHLRQVAST